MRDRIHLATARPTISSTGYIGLQSIDGPDDPLERSADETAKKALRSAEPGTAEREEVSVSVRSPFGPAVTQRNALDPANVAVWDWYAQDPSFLAKDPSFLETVGAAAGAAQQIEKQLATTQVPKTDDEREAFERQVLTLIRLDAVKLVGQHRSELAARKQQFEEMATASPGGAQSAPAGADANSRAADLANAIRAAAAYVTLLNTEKSALEDLRDVIKGAVRVIASPETIDEESRRCGAPLSPTRPRSRCSDCLKPGARSSPRGCPGVRRKWF